MTEFNPQEHLTITDGRAYLPVAARLQWFREQYPNGRIETTLAHAGPEGAVVQATVTAITADGAVEGSGSGHGFAPWQYTYPPVETAETKAIGRALGSLGFGTQFAGSDFDDAHALADSPLTPPGGGAGGQKASDQSRHTGNTFSIGTDDPRGSSDMQDGPPPMPDDISDGDYMGGYGDPAPRRTVDDVRPRAAGGLEPTERQRKLVDVLVSQVNLDDNELRALCREATGKEFGEVDRRGISDLITALQQRKQEAYEAAQIG